jgi:L-alanine-DL-glutamate epimerase-like enolase superfamily enzyme
MKTAKIISVEAIPVYLPFREKVADSWGEYLGSNHGIVKILTEDGICGWGEISYAWQGGAHGMCREINDIWAVRLLGHDITEINEMCRIMDRLCVFSKRHLVAKAGIEMALWDLLGKYTGLSVSRLLGGRLRDRIQLTGGIPMAEPGIMAQIAQKRVEEGYRELKIKVGLDDEKDLLAVKMIRAVIPDNIRLRADANMAWRDFRHAGYMMDMLWDLGVHIIEQPLDVKLIDETAQLKLSAKNRIMIDEGAWDINDAKEILGRGTCDILHLYTCKAGGIGQMLMISGLASLYNVTCTIGSMPEGNIGAAASAQAAACMTNLSDFPSDIRGFTVYEKDVTVSTLKIEHGELIVPDEAGLGVSVDEERLKYLTK